MLSLLFIFNLVVMNDITVAIGVILNKEKNGVYITKRHKDKHLGDLWEFPGGKVEANESINAALVRELYEEVGIHVKASTFFQKIYFTYPDKSVALYFYIIDEFEGMPKAKEAQKIAEVSFQDLSKFAMPKANETIVEDLLKMRLKIC
ncbi:8-oxo-dGTP diphosphatase MutT [Facilibium subflavum]|uniref:8-oxo-dGTP diphosphatase MutT n=1 Tax=Facilibium subflavum TaxID=2219058 RepID=UPI0013C36C8B|nr:8-oxo-dGTP diphosphatase MutT [Facilibium subflavum]